MEKENKNELKKRKKMEVNRVATLVEKARARDPRIMKDKEEEKQKKGDAKVCSVHFVVCVYVIGNSLHACVRHHCEKEFGTYECGNLRE